jgi:hypothetical protein
MIPPTDESWKLFLSWSNPVIESDLPGKKPEIAGSGLSFFGYFWYNIVTLLLFSRFFADVPSASFNTMQRRFSWKKMF